LPVIHIDLDGSGNRRKSHDDGLPPRARRR
jgi:hypothetical protein